MINKKDSLSRRDFLAKTSIAGLGMVAAGSMTACSTKTIVKPGAGMELGLVTYQWGKDWDLPTLIANCETAKFSSVELRTHHAHGVEPTLSAAEREEVKKRFADSPVVCVGYGSNQEYHSPDPAKLKENIEGTYELIKLCHDIGATGVKVKPNFLPEEVPAEKTIEQIGKSLNTIGKYAADYGQKIRVEVHGRLTQKPVNMRAIFDHVDQPNVFMCWNCNEQDLEGQGLEYNFNLLKKDFGDTVHIRELNVGDYPYQQLMDLFVAMDYKGYLLLEARTEPADRVVAMQEQLALFNEMIANAQAKLG